MFMESGSLLPEPVQKSDPDGLEGKPFFQRVSASQKFPNLTDQQAEEMIVAGLLRISLGGFWVVQCRHCKGWEDIFAARRWGDGSYTHYQGISCWAQKENADEYQQKFLGRWSG